MPRIFDNIDLNLLLHLQQTMRDAYCAKEFYSSIRNGILHQAETKNGWIIMREGILFDEPSRTIYSTIFRRRTKKCLKAYCDELEMASDTSDVWKVFKTKMAYVIQNCHMGDFVK